VKYRHYSPYEYYPTINLKAGDKLKLSWEARNNEMVVVVRNANVTSTNVHGKNKKWSLRKRGNSNDGSPNNFLFQL
jgi:hypothetical protein